MAVMECSTVDAVPALPRQPLRTLIGRSEERAWCRDGFARRRVLAICGLAGIGKTSLLLAAAHEQAARVGGAVSYHACADGDRIGDAVSALLAGEPGARPRATALRVALDEIVARAQRRPLVLCIDDAHRMADPMLLDVLVHLGAAPAALWLIVASRRHVPLPEADIDGAILRLGPLSFDCARELWIDLEERFGPSLVLFDALDAARRGSPFALRRAFAAGMRGGGEGLAGAAGIDGVDLGGLGPEQAALLAQICAFDGPVSIDRLAAVVPAQIAALPGLIQALLVDVTTDRSVTVHDIVRAAVAASARPPGVTEHEACLRFHETGGHELARLRHSVGAGRWEAAARLIDRLVAPHYGFFPMGAAAERAVLAAFDALDGTSAELSLPLRLARLQLAARAGHGQRVLELLRHEAALAPAAWPHLGAVELLLGDARAAEGHLRQALAEPSLPGGPLAQLFLLGLLLEVLRTQGSVEPMREVQHDFERIAAQFGPIGAAVAQVLTAAMAYDREDFADAADRLAAARPCIALLTRVPTLQAMHALLERTSHLAILRSPDEVVPAAAVTCALFEDVDFFRATLLLFAADGDLLEGNVAQAEARARDAEAVTTRCGYLGLRQWALYVRIECMRMRGLTAAAVELAEQALADPVVAVHRRQRLLLRAAAALGMAQLGRLPEARVQVPALDEFAHAPVKAARLSLLPWIEPPEPGSVLARVERALAQLERALAAGELEPARRWSDAAGPVRGSRWQYLRARLAVLDAELAVRGGDAASARAALAEAEALCSAHGYRREHAVAALIAVAVARLAGDREAAGRWAQVAADRAAGIADDIAAAARALGADVPPAGAAWLDRLELAAPLVYRLRDPAGVCQLTRRQADAVRFGPGALGIDVARRTVHVDGVAQPLASRRGLWSVLAALASRPGEVVSPDDIARNAWGVDYHAVRHRSRLVVTIKRLRDALGGPWIATVEGGYALSAPTWIVLEPIEPHSPDRQAESPRPVVPLDGPGA